MRVRLGAGLGSGEDGRSGRGCAVGVHCRGLSVNMPCPPRHRLTPPTHLLLQELAWASFSLLKNTNSCGLVVATEEAGVIMARGALGSGVVTPGQVEASLGAMSKVGLPGGKEGPHGGTGACSLCVVQRLGGRAGRQSGQCAMAQASCPCKAEATASGMLRTINQPTTNGRLQDMRGAVPACAALTSGSSTSGASGLQGQAYLPDRGAISKAQLAGWASVPAGAESLVVQSFKTSGGNQGLALVYCERPRWVVCASGWVIGGRGGWGALVGPG